MTRLEYNDLIVNEDESTENCICYNLSKNINIFEVFMNDLEDIRINISKNSNLSDLIDSINEYIHYLNNCENELKIFYENELGESVYKNWYNDLEVYAVDITFNSKEDYGASIACGDQIYSDHILNFQFDNKKIDYISLNG